MDALRLLIVEIFLPLAIVALMHFKLSSYPKPLSVEVNPGRGILETLIFWAIAVAVLTAIIFSDFAAKMAEPTAGTLVQFILIRIYCNLISNFFII